MALEDWGIKPVVPISDEQFALWQGLIEIADGYDIYPNSAAFFRNILVNTDA
jgi:uncharacterized protein YbdZ (MbtH family)